MRWTNEKIVAESKYQLAHKIHLGPVTDYVDLVGSLMFSRKNSGLKEDLVSLLTIVNKKFPTIS